jgi:hypothetical protein
MVSPSARAVALRCFFIRTSFLAVCPPWADDSDRIVALGVSDDE